jgi:hypothetical protein
MKSGIGDQGLPEMFWRHVHPVEDGCWLWGSTLDRDGYAVWRNRRAHRVIYQSLVAAIQAGFVTDHLCRQRSCVNPSHLEIVTQRENVRRGFHVALRRPKLRCKNGHDLSGDNLRVSNGERACYACRRVQSRDGHRRRRAQGRSLMSGQTPSSRFE